ncbi:MAG TPA: GNAT family N-acetyltransferase [Caulobacteraceae bacterium]|jgi:ribosomal protein S18 acetylase RimI-like enzyme|nr:GNAT family N-acetyltransferase [Caulobacteraceae bacterium]
MDVERMHRDAETPVKAGAADLDSVSRDLAAAFVGDPLFDWLSRADPGRDAARFGFFRHLMKALILPAGEILRPAAGGAAAVWMGSETLGPNTLIEELQALPMLLRLTGFRRFSRMIGLREVMDRAHPTDRPHAYLWFLGVTPQAQGHGIGSRLLKAKLDQLDAAGVPAFLETATERNVALYRRHGFDVISQYRAAADAPPMWAMWREAAAGGG